MHLRLGVRTAAMALLLSAGVIGQVAWAGAAGAVTTSQASLSNGVLSVTGTAAPSGFVEASSTTSFAGAHVDQQGRFSIRASGFTAPDCYVTLSDGGTTPTATVPLQGCTRSVKPVGTPAPPTGSCMIVPQDPVTLTAGTNTSVFFTTTGCNTADPGSTPTPVQWSVVAGVIPTGMTGPNSQGTTAGNIIGTPSIPGTYQFTLQVTDQSHNTDQENFTVIVK